MTHASSHAHARDRVRVSNVIVSTANKAGLDVLLPALPRGATVYSTGGTMKAVRAILGDAGPVRWQTIESYTAYPEMPGGLVKTLHPRIHAGLLGDTHDPDHVAHMEEQGAVAFDLVVANLYPFTATVATPGATPEEIRQQIDIGGPTMIRAAAKNHLRVAVAVEPDDYPAIAAELREHDGTLGYGTRLGMARRAFQHIAAYDIAISAWFDQLSDAAAREAWRVA
mgnify:CR=1 FL=1